MAGFHPAAKVEDGSRETLGLYRGLPRTEKRQARASGGQFR
jgi:hypothetical protein